MYKFPILPLSALGCYLIIMVLWNLNIIPSPKDLVLLLENLYLRHGYLTLILATFLEGIAYVCLYAPGAFIIALTVFFSDKSFWSLLTISGIVSTTLTVAAAVNYVLGRYIATRDFWDKKQLIKESEMLSKGLFISMLHPNFLAFYFFNAGLEKRGLIQILYVPIFMLPYGLLVSYLLSTFAQPIRQGLESPVFVLTIIAIWIIITFVKENESRFHHTSG